MIHLVQDTGPRAEDVDPRMGDRISVPRVDNVLFDSPIHRGVQELRGILTTSECCLVREQIYRSDLFPMVAYEQCPGA